MIDFTGLRRAVERHGKIVRLVLAEVEGSAPRDVGVSMTVWPDAHDGTIGGGRLEFDALIRAREMLRDADAPVSYETHIRTGSDQTQPGRITLAYEMFDDTRLAQAEAQAVKTGMYMRPLEPEQDMPLSISALRQDTAPPVHQAQLIEGWLIEPVQAARLAVYIYGAGHVGRALALALAPLEQFDVLLCDVREDQFAELPDTICQSWEYLPTDIMADAPDDAVHIIATPEPDYDLELCHRLLSRSFGFAGLVGSDSKWRRFQSELLEKGHGTRQLNRVQCPVGDKSLGKQPQAIAIGIATQLLRYHADAQAMAPEAL